MKSHTSQSGFSIIELLLAVVALGLIGFAGNYVYQTNKAVATLNSKTAVQDSTKAAITPTLTTPSVTSVNDLTTASTALDQNDPTTSNSSDSAMLDAELASF